MEGGRAEGLPAESGLPEKATCAWERVPEIVN